MPRYVIHKHERKGEKLHWDLMLEKETGDLMTFRVSCPPNELSQKEHQLEKIFDHAPKFLTYQGPVNNGEGRVSLEDQGWFDYLDQSDSFLEIDFKGEILKGRYSLKNKSGNNWSFLKV